LKILCLSPHYDDAVLACGGMLHRQRQDGAEIQIFNLFTRTAPMLYRRNAKGTEAPLLDAQRREEESAALAHLGLTSQDLGHFDAPYRSPRYRSARALVGPIPTSEKPLLTELTREIEYRARQLQPDLILAPLAVGHHIDHQLTHEVGRRLEGEFRLAYYEDMPYSLVPHALGRRLRELGATPQARRSPIKAAREAAQYPHPETHLPRWRQDWAELRRMAWTLREELRVARSAPPQWLRLPQTVPLSQTSLTSKIEALCLYHSQFPRFFGSVSEAQSRLQAYSQSFAPGVAYAERFWVTAEAAAPRPTPTP
jgi:LmbE family N-acetylglucosaminyl deacetylase